MMLLISLTLAAQAVPAPDTAQEVVVIGQKLKAWRASIRFGKGGARCKIKESTGDAEIDRIGCAAVEQCWPQSLPRFEAARAKGLEPREAQAKTAAANEAMAACVMAKRETLIGAPADKRVAARAGS